MPTSISPTVYFRLQIRPLNTDYGVNMKKLFSLILIVCLVFPTLCSCSSGNNDNPAPPVVNTVKITFTEGSTVSKIASLLEENGVCRAADFISEVNSSDSPFVSGIPNPADRPFLLEGYVFPDTYEFYLNESPESALSRFLKNSESKLGEEITARAEEIGYTVDEILIIASIIQKEAGIVSQMKTVSSVLHNRLDSSYAKLECDVTYNYIRDTLMPFLCGDEWVDSVYEKYADLYYTYRFGGLPAGPICNPGLDAVLAALYPEDTDYYYFVTDSEGNYYYSETFSEHQKICNSID